MYVDDSAAAVKTAVILVGDELLAGHTRDANGHYLAQRLTSVGHRLRRIAVVADEAHAIQAEVDLCLQQAQMVFVCGGLGPTHDDRTTESLAAHFGRRLVVDAAGWEKLRSRYGKRMVSSEVEEAAKKMVLVPEGAEVLENPVGAAVGYVLHVSGGAVVVLPGVPAELQAIFDQVILGRHLQAHAPLGLVEVDLEMAEAQFAAQLGEVAQTYGDVEIGSYPHFGERRVTLRFRGEEKRARSALDSFFERLPEARERVVGRAK